MQGSDRVDQLAPVADSDDPDLPQVLDREPRQDIGVNAVLGERPRVLPQAQALEPSRDVHPLLPDRPTRIVLRSFPIEPATDIYVERLQAPRWQDRSGNRRYSVLYQPSTGSPSVHLSM